MTQENSVTVDQAAEKPVNRKHKEWDHRSEYLRASTFSKLRQRENDRCTKEEKKEEIQVKK